MNGRPQVSIRLGTSGRSDVERDFTAIGDSGEAQAKRYQAAWERASANAEAALDKQAKAAARLATVSASPVQQQINAATGVSSVANDTGAARASAAAFASQLDSADAAAKRLLASVDPLYAAQLRYNTALDEAITLNQMGVLSEEKLAQVKIGLKSELDQQTALLGKNGLATNQSRIAQMEFEHAIRGSMDAMAAGASPAQVFSMHLGMLAQAAQLSGGSMGKFGEFLGGPWGIALTVAVMALGPLVTKLVESGSATDALVDKLKKEAQQTRDNQVAHNIFAQTLDGVTDAERRNEDALKKLSDQHESAAQKALAGALANIENTKTLRDNTAAQLANAQAVLAVMQAQMSGPGHQAEVAAFGIQQQEGLITGLQAALATTGDTIAKEQANVLAAMSHLSVDAMEKVNDPVNRIKLHYAGLIDDARKHAEQVAKAAQAAGDEAKAQQLVGTALKEQVAALQIKEDAEIKAAQDRNRKGPANAGGTAIFNEQIASFFDIANKYRGDSETGDKGVLESFFRAANENLDPEKVAWCAAFVNAVLAAGGVHGSGSLAAKSFLNYGKDDTHSPQKGDIVVLRTGANQQHVGFLDSIDKAGNVSVLAGNTSNKVGEATYSKNQVLAIRRPPTPSEQAEFDDKAAQKSQAEQTTFDDQLGKLREQYLAALQKTLSSADESAAAQMNLAQSQHDQVATDIKNALAAGKYGDATSQLAKARAAQLEAANDAALNEKQAAIAVADFVKKSKEAQDAADRKYKYELDDLKVSEEFARTSGDRGKLQHQILDIEYQQKLADLEALKARQIELQQFKAAADTQAEIDRLPTDKAHEGARIDHQNMSPWDAFLNSLPQSWGEVKDIIEKDGVQAIEDFNNQLADAIVNGKSLGDVLHSVFTTLLADLIKLSEQEAESALFGKGQGSSGGSSSGGLMSVLMSLFHIGSAMAGMGFDPSGMAGTGSAAFDPGTTTSLDTSVAGSLPGGFATGTEYFPGGTAWVGEHGPELVRLPQGSKIHTAADSRRLAAANDSAIGAISIVNHNDFRGADPAAIGAMTERVNQLERSIPTMAVSAVQDARSRFLIR